jgi:acyl carrier protein
MSHSELIQWLAGLFDEPVGNLETTTRREEIFGWDSLGMLTLMAELDEKFGIQLADADIERLQTVGDVIALISDRAKAA